MNQKELDDLRRRSEQNIKKEKEYTKFVKKYGKEAEGDFNQQRRREDGKIHSN